MDNFSLIGCKFDTGVGECVVLYVNPKYLILFNGEKFIKANDYNYDIDESKLYWSQGTYYDNFIELALDISDLVNKSIGLKQ